jgi:RHS repeat-associated protein
MYGTGGQLTSADGPLAGTGDSTSYSYNSKGFLQTTTDEVGHVATVTAWNGRGQPTSVTGANNVATAYGYDALGRITSIAVNPGSSQTQWTFAYTPAGDLATLTQPNGAVYTMTWDDARRLTAITNNLGEAINYARDAMGDATGTTIVAADGKTVMYQVANTFDELGRLIKQVGGEKATWSYAYDRTDLLTGTTDPRGKALGYGYDAVSRLVQETERDGGVVAHAYNGKSEETAYTDPRSLATTYVRDGFGDVIQETSPDRGTTVYDYDARGLMTSRRDARGKQTTYGYDNAGRLTSASFPATPALNVVYTYDGNPAGPNGIGHVTHVQDAAGTTDYTYDVVGRVSGETRTFGSKAYTTSYTYDQTGTGKLIFMTLPGGQMLNYSYDALGRISGVSIGSGYSGPFTPVVSNLSYFPFGSLREIDFNNGVVRYENNDLEYKLDGLFLTKSSTTLVERYHSFGDHLNLLELNNDSVDTSRTQYLGYDDAQRLTSASASGTYGTRSWTYDLVGNRLSEVKTPAGSSTSTTSRFTYPTTSNLLTAVTQGSTTTRAFTYDAAGNTIKDTRGSTAYNYAINDAGRIAQLTIGTTVTANYIYDAKDRLSVRQTLNMSPAGTTQMLYDVWDHLLAETDGAGHVVKQYIWVGDEPVAVLDGTSNAASPTLYYVHADHLQRPELMTDAAGTAVWTVYYEPFGAVSSVTGPLTQNQRFSGQWFQIEAGLHYNWHRHYDPTLGRYTSADPLGLFLSPQVEPQEINVSHSASNNSNSEINYDGNAHEANIVPRDGVSIFGYVGQSPLQSSDKNGLIRQLTSVPNPKTPQQCSAGGYNWGPSFWKPKVQPDPFCSGVRSACSATCSDLLPTHTLDGAPFHQCMTSCIQSQGC